jgi:hypothetical protein
MNWGIRQSCPISGIIFRFVVEILATNIRSTLYIKGFQKPGMTHDTKIIQHDDDCTLPLKDNATVTHSRVTNRI